MKRKHPEYKYCEVTLCAYLGKLTQKCQFKKDPTKIMSTLRKVLVKKEILWTSRQKDKVASTIKKN